MFDFILISFVSGAELYIWLGTDENNKGNNDFLA